MRVLALSFLLAATPAAAQTPEQKAVAECIRNLPPDVMIYQGSKSCMPPAKPNPFRLLSQQSAAREVVSFHVALSNCSSATRGPKADQFWKSMIGSFKYSEPNIPQIKEWMRDEFAKMRRETITPSGGWCEEVKYLYGDHGRKQRNAIVMRNGSTSTAKCVLDGSCSAANTFTIYID